MGTSQGEQSESRVDHLECSCDMRVSFSLLTDLQDDGASPRDVSAIIDRQPGSWSLVQ